MSSLTAEKFLDLDPTMIREIATGLEEPVDVAARYGFSKEEFKDLARMPEFRAEVSRIQSEMQRSGQTFKLMAGEMAHKLLEDMFQHSLGGETPVRDKAAALQLLTKIADLEPKKDAAVKAGPGFSITINIPQVPKIEEAQVIDAEDLSENLEAGLNITFDDDED